MNGPAQLNKDVLPMPLNYSAFSHLSVVRQKLIFSDFRSTLYVLLIVRMVYLVVFSPIGGGGLQK
jgi:hypothetical protein